MPWIIIPFGIVLMTSPCIKTLIHFEYLQLDLVVHVGSFVHTPPCKQVADAPPLNIVPGRQVNVILSPILYRDRIPTTDPPRKAGDGHEGSVFNN